MTHECPCDECPECLVEAQRLRALILEAVRTGETTEEKVYEAIFKVMGAESN
jgi:hypothetical protein